MNPIETYKLKSGKTLEVHCDPEPPDPRKEFDNLAVMVCFSRRYKLGDEHDYKAEDYNGWDELEAAIIKKENAVVIMPLFLYDHSGLRIKVGSFQGLLPQFHAEFDSSQVGFIFVPRQKVLDEWGVKRISPKLKATVENNLRAEVEVYDDFLSGQVYGFVVKDADGEEVDSCWGFYGGDHKENGMLDQAGEELA